MMTKLPTQPRSFAWPARLPDTKQQRSTNQCCPNHECDLVPMTTKDAKVLASQHDPACNEDELCGTIEHLLDHAKKQNTQSCGTQSIDGSPSPCTTTKSTPNLTSHEHALNRSIKQTCRTDIIREPKHIMHAWCAASLFTATCCM